MYRIAAVIGMLAVSLCGCGRRDVPPESEAAQEEQTPTLAVEAETPAAPVAPAEPNHAAVGVARDFLEALAAGELDTAVALSVQSDLTAESLRQIQYAFQMDKATVEQTWVGREQVCVVTNFVPTRDGSAVGAWGLALVQTGQTGWEIRDGDFLRDQAAIDRYLVKFRQAEPTAQLLAP